MDGFYRRGDVWWARLAVPARLRSMVGRREYVQSTRTTDKHAGRVIASALLAEWRRRLFMLEGGRVEDSQVRKLIGGAPALALGGHLTLRRAIELLGFELGDLLRAAAAGRLRLSCRMPPSAGAGYLVERSALELVDTEMGRAGGVVIPHKAPLGSFPAHVAGRLLPVPDSALVAGIVLSGGLDAVVLLALEAPERAGWLFVPEPAITVPVGDLEVWSGELEALRAAAVAVVPAAHLESAWKAPAPASVSTINRGGKWAAKCFSEALAAYCASPDGLPKSLTSETEQRQRQAGMMLFPEFMGDLMLGEIDGDVLRAYRDGPLKTLPGDANHLPKTFKRPTMTETIAALRVAGTDWPLMTAGMQRERMSWLRRFFAWLVARGYMDANPAAGLAGETGVSKADAKAARRARISDGEEDEEGRDPFNDDQLNLIFSQPQYVSGDGRHVKGANKFDPSTYWLPLLGLYGGLRVKEASQLYLRDVRQVEGAWVFDVNEFTADKSLKNGQSARLVPIHPVIIHAGFLDYCTKLKAEGYQRVFPELTCVAADARYAKGTGRRMSQMLEALGMPRDGTLVYHCLRHNMNNALVRVPGGVFGFADSTLVQVARHGIMGHDLPPELRSVNTRTYLRSRMSEMAALVAAVQYEGLPAVARFDIDWGVEAIRDALGRKHGDRKGREDMGECWTSRGA